MVLVVNGTSWVGFGWRPKKLTAECRKFPLLQDIGASAAEPSAEPEPVSEVASSAEPSHAEPASEVASSAEPSHPEPASETSAEPSHPEPASEATAEPKSEPSSKTLEPLALGSSKSKRVAAPQTIKAPNSKDESHTVSTSVSYRVSTVTGRRKREAQKGRISRMFYNSNGEAVEKPMTLAFSFTRSQHFTRKTNTLTRVRTTTAQFIPIHFTKINNYTIPVHNLSELPSMYINRQQKE